MKLELKPLTPAQSRAAAVALLLAILAAAGAAVAIPTLLLHKRYDDAIASRIDRIRRERRIMTMAPALHKQLADLRDLNAAQYYLHSRNPALAAAEIQDTAKRLIDASGCKLLSTGTAPATSEDSLTRITVNMQLSGAAECLQQTLYGLENASPYLFVDNLSVRTNPFYNPNNTANQAPIAQFPLQIQFDVSGYVQGGKP